MYVAEKAKRRKPELLVLEKDTLGQLPFLQQLPTWLVVGFLAFMVWRNMTGLKSDLMITEKLPEIEERLVEIEAKLGV